MMKKKQYIVSTIFIVIALLLLLWFVLGSLKSIGNDEKHYNTHPMKQAEAQQAISEKLLMEYQVKEAEQQWLVLIMSFISSLILLLLLLYNRKILRTARELRAFKYAVENSDNMVMMTNKNREITYVNDEFERVSGYTKEETIGAPANLLKSNLMPEEVYMDIRKRLDHNQKWQGEFINTKKDGSLLYEKASIVPMQIEGEILGYLSIKLDITKYVEQQQKLELSATVFENTKDGILILDQMGQIISANNALMNMSGYDLEELVGRTASLINPEIIINLDNIWRGRVILQKSDKTKVPVWLSVSPVYPKNKMITLIAIYTDLSEVIRTQKQADFLQYHDRLTLLPNRLNIERAMELKCRQNQKENLGIMIIGIDKLSIINDSLGYAVGDSLLVTFSKLLYEVMPDDILLGRWDGNKFIVLLEMDEVEITLLVNHLLETIAEPLLISGHRLKLNINIGISLYSDEISDASSLINFADISMHHSRSLGSNQYQFYSKDISTNIQSRLTLENALQEAIEKGEFILYYQPQYDLSSKKVVGVETLIRWYNQELGWVSPDRFLFITEENGMIVDLGFYIFKEACKAYMRWVDLGLTLETIAINVSSQQLKDKHFFETIKEIIEEVKIPTTAIEIELTEGFLVENSYTNLSILNALRELGCKIAIDDFGTGYSSMSYLKELPIDIVKIDKSFIDEISSNRYDQTVSKVIVSLAHSLEYKVIAEGIETQEQEEILEEYGCDIGQGFFFSRPLDEENLIAFMKQRNFS